MSLLHGYRRIRAGEKSDSAAVLFDSRQRLRKQPLF
jgi:hypothetical protein